MLNTQILTIHPQIFPGTLSIGVVGNALNNLWRLNVIDIRNFAQDKHQTVDDTPYGGGAGMVMKADVISHAIKAALSKTSTKPPCLIYTTPRGVPFTQKYAQKLSQQKDIIILCGRYEDVDQRVVEHYKMQEISLGDFVLNGGEIAAQAILEATVRLVPGVLGNDHSLQQESFNNELLECHQYTKPYIWQERAVPSVLLSGNHKDITQWRLKQSKMLTRNIRPDLWTKYLSNLDNIPS